MKASAVAMPYMNPLHTACRSNAVLPFTPSFAWRRHAVLGNTSGVEVATMMRSISCAATPAACRKRFDASSARSLEVCAFSAMWRWTIPVRSRIQASLVSSRAANSALVMMRARQVAAGAADARIDHCSCAACGCSSMRAAMRCSTLLRTSSTARSSAWPKAKMSAEPWLFTTMPREPSRLAPL